MKIEASSQAFHSASERRGQKPSREAAPEKETAREKAALPAVLPQDRQQPRPRGSYAPLVAQLIATKLDMPQTRARRRAEPATAIGAYNCSLKTMSVPGRLHRSV